MTLYMLKLVHLRAQYLQSAPPEYCNGMDQAAAVATSILLFLNYTLPFDQSYVE